MNDTCDRRKENCQKPCGTFLGSVVQTVVYYVIYCDKDLIPVKFRASLI